MTHDEIALALGVSQQAVRATEKRAILKLRRLAKREGMDPTDYMTEIEGARWIFDDESN